MRGLFKRWYCWAKFLYKVFTRNCGKMICDSPTLVVGWLILLSREGLWTINCPFEPFGFTPGNTGDFALEKLREKSL